MQRVAALATRQLATLTVTRRDVRVLTRSTSLSGTARTTTWAMSTTPINMSRYRVRVTTTSPYGTSAPVCATYGGDRLGKAARHHLDNRHAHRH